MNESHKPSVKGRKFRLFLIGTCLPGLACSSVATPKPELAPTREVAPAQIEILHPTLTVDEKIVEDGLKRHIEMLSQKIGERNPQKLWELADAADYLANELERLGFPVERQGYEAAGITAQNLAITVHGGARGDETLVLGAHYDSPPGSSGSNAGATGVAALLEVARLMRDARLHRSLRIVFFALGESPHGDGQARGAYQYAKKLSAEAEEQPKPGLPEAVAQVSRVIPLGLIHVDRIGVFRSPECNSTKQAAELFWSASDGGERLFFGLKEALSGDPFRFVDHASSAADAETELGVEGGKPESDTAAFSELKYPTLSLSGSLNSPGCELQYQEMAQFVMRLRYGIGEILGEMPTNDGMVTPFGAGLR